MIVAKMALGQRQEKSELLTVSLPFGRTGVVKLTNLSESGFQFTTATIQVLFVAEEVR